MTRYRYLILVWFCLSLGLLYATPASAAEVLDQSQTVSESPQTVPFGQQWAQIFTAGQYGRLDRVSLRLENNTAYPSAGYLAISVQTVIGGLPSGEQIGSGSIPLSTIPPLGSPGWVDVSITGAALVHPGAQYALVLQMGFFASVTWWYASNTGYAGGAMAANYGAGWVTQAQYDFTFQTYVAQDLLDQWQTQFSNRAGPVKDCGLGLSIAQTFTAGLSGALDRVSVRVYTSSYYSDFSTINATIETVNSDDEPSGHVVGQGSISGTFNGWVTIDISGAVVTAGHQYALVLDHPGGDLCWYKFDDYNIYTGGKLWDEYHWRGDPDYKYQYWSWAGGDGAFQTYVAQSVASAPPPPATLTPCSRGVCPAASGSVTPGDSTARVTGNAQFRERSDGRVHGVLNFNDSKTGDFVLQGCSTDSAACRLTVTTFACTDDHAITVAGTYTPKRGAAADYLLTLSGAKDRFGTFTLTAGDYSYTVGLDGIVDVTCP